MDIVEELDLQVAISHDDLLSRSADAIVLEREIADKLYRALNALLDVTGANEYAYPVILEALESYSLARLAG